jgi:predicted flap endonuclease-1-like 5' DNA nuclease
VLPIRTVRLALPSFLGGLSLGLLAWRWLRRGDVAEIDRRRLEGEAESERLRLRLTSIQDAEPVATESGRRDDLQRIKGIGPVMERSLNELGIQSYEQIASFTKADIDRLTDGIAAFPGRIEREDWVGSARRLLDREETSSPS